MRMIITGETIQPTDLFGNVPTLSASLTQLGLWNRPRFAGGLRVRGADHHADVANWKRSTKTPPNFFVNNSETMENRQHMSEVPMGCCDFVFPPPA